MNQLIQIDQLRLKLPAQYAPQADHIVRHVAKYLSQSPAQGNLSAQSLLIPALRLSGGETAAGIARKIANGIRRQINADIRQGAGHGK